MVKKRDKSEQTLAAIVKAGLDLASLQGLRGVTLGAVAKRLHISKSGVFVRAGSLEALQNLVLDEYEEIFSRSVFLPALAQPPGLPRLDAIMRLWIGSPFDDTSVTGALHGVGAFELDHTNCALRERLIRGTLQWRQTLARTVEQSVTAGHLRADTPPEQMVFELFGLMLAFLYDTRLLTDPLSSQRATGAYTRLVASYRR
ncbi:MAG TPA: TetR/AcrR family transcriptional regulator [Rhizobacter sp.]|nr:TetR/AcrR family transcriptional regulator [Rhizobacter sp.]